MATEEVAEQPSTLTVFLLCGPVVDVPLHQAAPAAPAATRYSSISEAWNSFISPAPSEKVRRLSVQLKDSALTVGFRFPEAAAPPPRLGAFALPSLVDADSPDKPRDCSFALTHDDGGRLYGTVLQLCEPVRLSDAGGGEAADGAEAGDTVRCELSALVVLSVWPMYEMFKFLLHHVYAQREALWPTAAEGAARLCSLLEAATRALSGSRQELEWLTSHPLWLPVPLAPLFKALRWEPAEAAYLLLALLTDQKVLLHSSDPSLLFCAGEALRALITPLEYRAVYIPLLPAPLMSLDEVRTLLADCSTPYLIGVDTCLLHLVLGRGKGQGKVPGKVAELLPLSVVVDLDAGTVHHPAATSWFKPSQPPVLSLVRELSGCMGDVMQFRPAAAQAACLRFVVDALNLSAGFLARSPAPADAEAASRLQLLRRYEEDLRKRCAAAGMEGAARAVLARAMHQSAGALLGDICAEASDAARHRSAERGAPASPGGAGGGGRVSFGGLGDACAFSSVDQPSAPTPADACAQLRHVYSSMAFRDWWMEPARARSPERLQWMEYRAKGIDLIEYVRENRATLATLERSVDERMHAAYASAAPAAAPAAPAARPPPNPYGDAALPRAVAPALPRATPPEALPATLERLAPPAAADEVGEEEGAPPPVVEPGPDVDMRE